MENRLIPNGAVCLECGSSEIGQRPNGSFFCKNCGADVICATCPECGSGEIGKKFNGGYFCKNCGAEIFSCSQCGSFDLKKGGDGRLFCRNCGAKLGETAALAEVVESVAPVTVKLPTLPKADLKKISKSKLPKKSINWKSLGIVAGIALVAMILTAIFVTGNCPLENEWVFGSNSYVFNKDGTFEANNTLSNSGTYTVEGDQLHLHYAFMGMLEKDTTLTYSIKGKVLTLSGDVALIGSGNETVPYECAGGGGNGLKIILIIAELLAAAAVIFFKILKPKQKNDPKPKKEKMGIAIEEHENDIWQNDVNSTEDIVKNDEEECIENIENDGGFVEENDIGYNPPIQNEKNGERTEYDESLESNLDEQEETSYDELVSEWKNNLEEEDEGDLKKERRSAHIIATVLFVLTALILYFAIRLIVWRS